MDQRSTNETTGEQASYLNTEMARLVGAWLAGGTGGIVLVVYLGKIGRVIDSPNTLPEWFMVIIAALLSIAILALLLAEAVSET